VYAAVIPAQLLKMPDVARHYVISPALHRTGEIDVIRRINLENFQNHLPAHYLGVQEDALYQLVYLLLTDPASDLGII